MDNIGLGICLVLLTISLIVNLYQYRNQTPIIEFDPEALEPDPDGIVQTRKHLGRIANRRVALMEHHYHNDKAKRHAWVSHKLLLHDPSLTQLDIDNYIKHGLINVREGR